MAWRAHHREFTPEADERRALIERCNRGDKQAWEEFHSRYAGMIAAVVGKLSGIASDHTEDVVQEVFLQLFKALKTYDPARPLEVYVLEIARRVRASRFRKYSALKRGGIHSHVPLDGTGDGPEAGAHQGQSVQYEQEERLIRREEIGRMRGALRAVKDKCRRLLQLRYEEGLTYKDIAGILRTKESTLRVQVQRCLTELGRIYERTPCGEDVAR